MNSKDVYWQQLFVIIVSTSQWQRLISSCDNCLGQRMWRMLGQKVRSARHNTVRHDGRLVTRFYTVTSWLAPTGSGADPDLDWPLCHCAMAQVPPLTNTGAPSKKMKIKNSRSYLITLNLFLTTWTRQCCSLWCIRTQLFYRACCSEII